MYTGKRTRNLESPSSSPITILDYTEVNELYRKTQNELNQFSKYKIEKLIERLQATKRNCVNLNNTTGNYYKSLEEIESKLDKALEIINSLQPHVKRRRH